LLAGVPPVERPFVTGRRPRRDDAADVFAFSDVDNEDFLTLANADRNPTLFAITVPLVRPLQDFAVEDSRSPREADAVLGDLRRFFCSS
jgi:hypothetical protein